MAVLVSPEDFDRLKDRLWESVDRLRDGAPDRDPDEVLREVTDVVDKVRREQSEQRQRLAASRR